MSSEPTPAGTRPSVTFEALIAGYLDDVFATHPVRATSLGVPGHDHRLNDRSEARILAERDRFDEWARRFDAVDAGDLTPDQQIDRELVRNSLRHRQVVRERGGYRASPGLYVNEGLAGVSALFVNRPGPEAELVDCAVARMGVIPAVLENGARQIDPDVTPRLAAERAARIASAAGTYFREGVPAEVDDPSLARRLAEAAAPVATAYEQFARFLARIAADAAGDWAYGEHLYSTVLRDCELLPFDASELLERGRDAYADATRTLAAGRSELGRAAQLHRASLPPFAEPGDRIAYLQERVDAARDFCAGHRLLSLPADAVCVVRRMPAHHRVVSAVAGYRQAPPFASAATGALLVPGSARARVLPAGSDSMVAHEAYPGHHAHLSRARRHGRPLRHVHGSSFLREGWGLYAEKLMHAHGFFADPVEQLAHLRAVRFRAARVLLDVGLHTGTLDPADGVTFMRDELGSREETARLEIERYCSNPIQAVAYHAGCLAIEDMRARYLAQPGASALDFHDRLTEAGTLPLALAERVLFRT